MSAKEESKLYLVKISEIEPVYEFMKGTMFDVETITTYMEFQQFHQEDFPLVLWENYEDKLKLISGHALFEAMKLKEENTAYAYVREFESDQEAFSAAIEGQEIYEKKMEEFEEWRKLYLHFFISELGGYINSVESEIAENGDITEEKIKQIFKSNSGKKSKQSK